MSRLYQKPSYILFERPVGSKCWTMCFKSRNVPFHASKLQTAINETRTRLERRISRLEYHVHDKNGGYPCIPLNQYRD